MSGLQRPPDQPTLYVRQDVYPFDRAQLPKGAAWDPVRVVTVEIVEGRCRGRGESVPYDRFGETVEEVIDTVERMADEIGKGLNRRLLQRALPPGAARNAIDCALWDFDAKKQESSVANMIGIGSSHRIATAFRIPAGTPMEMAARATQENHRPVLQLDLGDASDLDRIAAVHQAAPNARLLVDAQERWTAEQLRTWIPDLGALNVDLLEQPLPAGQDSALAGIRRDVPVAADESCYEMRMLDGLIGRYDAVTIKLDKVGGLTAALQLAEAARDLGFRIAVATPWCSSLGIAPAVLLAQEADWVVLDAPLFLARDRQPGLRYDGSILYPPNVSLWG